MRSAARSLVVLALFAWPALACDPCSVISLKRDYKRASAVFRAELISDHAFRSRLKVLERWKGEIGEEVEVNRVGGRSCPFRGFAPGVQYLVFAYAVDEELVVSDCSHTNPITTPDITRELETIRSRHAWWSSPLSVSLPWNRWR